MTRNRTYLVVAFILTFAPFALAQKGKKKKQKAPPAASATAPTVDSAVPPASSQTPTGAATGGATTGTTATPAASASTNAPEEGKDEEKKEGDEHRKPTSLALMGSFILPLGNHTDYTRTGFGLNLDGEHRVSPTFRLSARTGFHYHLDAKDFEVVGTNAAVTSRRVHTIPVLIGARFFPGETGWYVNAETGLFIRFFSKEDAVKNTGKTVESSQVKFNLGLGAGGGYQFGRCDLRATLHAYDLTHPGDSLAFALSFGYKFFEM